MSQDRKLHLVPPLEPSAQADVEPPPTEDELREAEALRLSLERGDDPIASALRGAWAPSGLDEADNEALLARALGGAEKEALSPPTQLEARSAQRLADELAGRVEGEGSSAYQLARALRAANAPRALDQVTNERLVQKAVGATAMTTPIKRRSMGTLFAMVSGLVAAAAVLALFVRTTARREPAPAEQTMAAAPSPAPAATAAAERGAKREDAPAAKGRAEEQGARVAAGRSRTEQARPAPTGAPAARSPEPAPARPAAAPPPPPAQIADSRKAKTSSKPGAGPTFAEPPPRAAHADSPRPEQSVVAGYIPARSTDDLFGAAPFPRSGGESSRVDRIAMARESDLRANRFAAWGVR